MPRLAAPSDSLLERILADARLATPSYPEIGATRAGEMPGGYRVDRYERGLGAEERRFERAVDALTRWQAQIGAGLRVEPAGAIVGERATVLFVVRMLGLQTRITNGYLDAARAGIPMSDVTIRTATAGDLPAIRDVYRRAGLSNEGDRTWIEAHPDEVGLDEANVIEGRTRVAVADGRIVGFATLVGIELEDLFTDPDWMRQGIATALVHELTATVERIELTANLHALAFYESVGFVSDGQVETSGGPALRMHREG